MYNQQRQLLAGQQKEVVSGAFAMGEHKEEQEKVTDSNGED